MISVSCSTWNLCLNIYLSLYVCDRHHVVRTWDSKVLKWSTTDLELSWSSFQVCCWPFPLLFCVGTWEIRYTHAFLKKKKLSRHVCKEEGCDVSRDSVDFYPSEKRRFGGAHASPSNDRVHLPWVAHAVFLIFWFVFHAGQVLCGGKGQQMSSVGPFWTNS